MRLKFRAPSSISRRPDFAAAGEADLVDARVRREGLADHRALADDAVGDALRQAGIRSRSSKIAIDDAGASLAGLRTNVQPVASAAPILRSGRSTGSFHGVISPHTPTGSLRTKFRRWLGPPTSTSPRIEPRGAGVEQDPVDGRLDLALANVADRLAHLGRDEPGQRLRLLAQEPGQLEQDRRRARLPARRRPAAVVERRRAPRRRPFDVLDARLRGDRRRGRRSPGRGSRTSRPTRPAPTPRRCSSRP